MVDRPTDRSIVVAVFERPAVESQVQPVTGEPASPVCMMATYASTGTRVGEETTMTRVKHPKKKPTIDWLF